MAVLKSAASPEKRTVSVRLSPDSARRLRVIAAKEGLSMGAYLARLWEESRGAGRSRREEEEDGLTSPLHSASVKQ